MPTKAENTRAKRSSRIAWKRESLWSLRPSARLRKMACPSALAGPFAVWCAAFSSTVDFHQSCGESSCLLRLNIASVCRTPGLTWRRRYGKKANLSHLKIIGARSFVHIKDAKKMKPKSWEGMLCGFSEDEALSYRVWNPKTQRVAESRNGTFIETPPHLIPQPTRLSPLRELPPAELVDDYTSTDDLLRDARDYTVVLDFTVNIPAEDANDDSVESGPGMETILEEIRDYEKGPDHSARRIFVWGNLVRRNVARGNTAGDIVTFFCAGPDAGRRSGSASALSGALSGTIRSSYASHRTSGATQQTCNYASARGKCTAAPTNTQWHRQPGCTFRATYTAQLALARSLHNRRYAGHCSPPR